jgi:hypothetical protein
MSAWPVSRRAGWLVGVLVLLVAGTVSAQVDPKSPYETAKVVGALGPLPGASGPLADSAINKTTPDDVHDGVYTWGLDLVNPGTRKPQDWFDAIFPTPLGPFAYTASPSFKVRLKDEALAAAQQHLDGLDPGVIGKAFEKFDVLYGNEVKIPTDSFEYFFGHWPVRARWLKSRWAPTGQAFWMVENQVKYADYAPFSDIRLRGARLYCAARRAQFVQGSQARSLGERVGFSIDVLGHSIDFLVLEPTVAIDGPSKFLAAPVAGVPPDGAQAFTIPFMFGTRVTPIRGIGLPSLGEARVPVVLVTGDTEVKTASNKRLIYEIGKGGLVAQNIFGREHHTVTHADAILSAGFYGSQKYLVDKEFPFFAFGPLLVSAIFQLTYEVGKPFLFTHEKDMPWHPDDRTLAVAPWQNTARAGHLYQNGAGQRYHDGAWLLTKKRASPYLEWQVLPDGSQDSFWTDQVVKPSHIDIRALANDDHKFATSTELGLTLGLKGELGKTFGPFTVSAEVNGTFTGTVAQNHLLRDALMAQAPPPGFLTQMVPSPMVSIRPEQTAKVTFDGIAASLHFHLDLLFDSIDFDETFLDVPGTTVADYSSANTFEPGDEQYMLRIGTGSALGQAMTKPAVYSHLPGGGDFPTFLEDVSACLADETPAPALKAPCPPEPGSGGLPTVNICVFGPSLSLIEKLGSKNVALPSLPPNACASLGSWPSGFGFDNNPALKACFANYVHLLCEAQSKQQPWEGQGVVSHVWNLDVEFGWQLQAAVEQCRAAFENPDTPISPPVKEILSELISVGPCEDDGLLVSTKSVVQAVNPYQAPKPKPGAACSVQ